MAAQNHNDLAYAFRKFKDYKPPSTSERIYSNIRRKSQSFFKKKTKKEAKKDKHGGKRKTKKCLVGQKRNRAGKIIRHGHYSKCRRYTQRK